MTGYKSKASYLFLALYIYIYIYFVNFYMALRIRPSKIRVYYKLEAVMAKFVLLNCGAGSEAVLGVLCLIC